MSESHGRFSLRSVFVAMTLAALIIGAAANYPIVLVVALVLVSPALFIGLMVRVNNQLSDVGKPADPRRLTSRGNHTDA
jgi:hypothetical protein